MSAVTAARISVRDILDERGRTDESEIAHQFHVLDDLAAEGQIGMVRVDTRVEYRDGSAGPLEPQIVVHVMPAGDLAGDVVGIAQRRIEVDALHRGPLRERIHLSRRENGARHRQLVQRDELNAEGGQGARITGSLERDDDLMWAGSRDQTRHQRRIDARGRRGCAGASQ